MSDEPEVLDVIFRRDRKKDPEITAVFPSLCGTNEYDMSCYAHIGQHGSCGMRWYHTTRAATPSQYADLLVELRQIYAPEYVLRVRHRINPKHREQRKVEMRRMEQAR